MVNKFLHLPHTADLAGAAFSELPATTSGLHSRPEIFCRVLQFTFREFAAIPSYRQNAAGLSQFLHSLNVNPCTPTSHRRYAKKFLMAAHNTPRTGKVNIFLLCTQAEYPVYRLERPSKILTHYGNTEKILKPRPAHADVRQERDGNE